MATLQFARVSGYDDRTATAQAVLRVAAVGTTSFVATTNVMDVIGWEYIIFSIIYTNGDETSYEMKAQLYDGTTWQDTAFKATQASNYSIITPDGVQLVKATFSTLYGAATIANFALPPVSCLGFQLARMVLKSTGGTPTGTIGVTATGACTVQA